MEKERERKKAGIKTGVDTQTKSKKVIRQKKLTEEESEESATAASRRSEGEIREEAGG